MDNSPNGVYNEGTQVILEMFTKPIGLDFPAGWTYNYIKVAEKTGDQDVSPGNRVKRSFQS